MQYATPQTSLFNCHHIENNHPASQSLVHIEFTRITLKENRSTVLLLHDLESQKPEAGG